MCMSRSHDVILAWCIVYSDQDEDGVSMCRDSTQMCPTQPPPPPNTQHSTVGQETAASMVSGHTVDISSVDSV